MYCTEILAQFLAHDRCAGGSVCVWCVRRGGLVAQNDQELETYFASQRKPWKDFKQGMRSPYLTFW